MRRFVERAASSCEEDEDDDWLTLPEDVFFLGLPQLGSSLKYPCCIPQVGRCARGDAGVREAACRDQRQPGAGQKLLCYLDARQVTCRASSC